MVWVVKEPRFNAAKHQVGNVDEGHKPQGQLAADVFFHKVFEEEGHQAEGGACVAVNKDFVPAPTSHEPVLKCARNGDPNCGENRDIEYLDKLVPVRILKNLRMLLFSFIILRAVCHLDVVHRI